MWENMRIIKLAVNKRRIFVLKKKNNKNSNKIVVKYLLYPTKKFH